MPFAIPAEIPAALIQLEFHILRAQLIHIDCISKRMPGADFLFAETDCEDVPAIQPYRF